VLEQDLGGLPGPLLVQPARGHVVQQSDVGGNLLGTVKLARDGHPVTAYLLDKVMPYLFSIGSVSLPRYSRLRSRHHLRSTLRRAGTFFTRPGRT
jgi:hypothetical protein